MKLDKIAGILMLTLFIGLGAFYFSDQASDKVSDQDGGTIFLPGLMAKINQVAQIELTDKNGLTHLVSQKDRWVVQEKSGYDAEFSKIKTLLLGLAELKTIEPKTAKPENYGRLGVQDAGEPGEVDSKQIRLLDKAGNVLYTLIIGKSKPSRTSAAQSAFYVRQLGEAKSWLVSGRIEIAATQTDWLDTQIIDIAPSRIQSIEIQRPDHGVLKISKTAITNENFAVESLPVNARLKSNSAVNTVANMLQNLTFEDVLSRGTFQANEADITRVVVETFDGLQLTAKLLDKEEKHYLWFDLKNNSENEKVAKESKILNAKFPLWVYEIQSFKADMFKKTLVDLLQTDLGE